MNNTNFLRYNHLIIIDILNELYYFRVLHFIIHENSFLSKMNFVISFLYTEAVAYEFGPGRGLITYTFPNDRRPEMKRDTVALGFVTSVNDAVLLRIESATSNDYLEIEIVSIQHLKH